MLLLIIDNMIHFEPKMRMHTRKSFISFLCNHKEQTEKREMNENQTLKLKITLCSVTLLYKQLQIAFDAFSRSMIILMKRMQKSSKIPSSN